MKIHKKINQILQLKSLNQREVAVHIGASFTALNKFLNGHSALRLNAFVKLLKMLEIDLEQLLLTLMINLSTERTLKKKELSDVEILLESIDSVSRKSLIGSLLKLTRNHESEAVQLVRSRLQEKL